MATTAKGMRITARYGVDPRETITLQYPEERWEPSERFRGFLHNDIKKCTSCSMCVKVCPVDCIALEAVRGADKKMVLVSYEIDIGRCMYCGLCVEVCPPKSLRHTSGYEKASVDRGELILHFVHEDANEIKSRVAKQVAEAAAKAEAEKAAKAAEEAKDAGPAPDAAREEAPAGQPASPPAAAANPAKQDAEEKKPAEGAKGESGKPEEPPKKDGGEIP
ncbi:MAG: NADH-quinone oxidoreductase subunit I [Candidatus Deferrimicrobiaceae bacterium]